MEAKLNVGRGLNVSRKVRSALANRYCSARVRDKRRRRAELKRRLAGEPHVVRAFLQADDPYSRLLAHYLPALAETYDIQLERHTIEALGDEFQPEPDMQAEYARDDCMRVASELGVTVTDCIDLAPLSPDSQALLARLGHYNSAMLHYGGEWYWGVDRLHFLTARLDELGLRQTESHNPALASIERAMRVSLPVTPPAAARDLPPLEYFISLRSPYSVVSLNRVFALADAFRLTLEIRLVLPMVARGMQVPRAKARYLLFDAAREAERYGVPFGDFADPLGAGIERVYAVHQYARAENRERDFILNAAAAIWGEGVDVATDDGLRKVTGRTGLFWPEVKEALQSTAWEEEVEANRAYMMASGSWGVPTFRLGDFVTWGQDRLWLLARHIEDQCDTGEGILV